MTNSNIRLWSMGTERDYEKQVNGIWKKSVRKDFWSYKRKRWYMENQNKRWIRWINRTFFFWRCDPTRVMASSFFEVSRSHTTTHHSRQDSSGWVISSWQRPLPDSTQHLQQTNIYAAGGIRTHDLSRRASADLRQLTFKNCASCI